MKTETKRGRPRKFDEDETLDRIMLLFWKNGYSATSLDQIAETTGLNRPSLYAAFGSKKAMYLKIIERFADRMHTYLRQAGMETEGAAPRLKAIMAAAIELYTGQTELNGAPYGCLAISTLQSEAVEDADFRQALDRVITRMDKGIASLIRHETRDSLTENEVREAAQHLALILHGLSIRARAGENPEALKILAESAVDKILPGTSHG
ncbi:MAG: TetR/AcrR family transcriptional regulator [Roseibium sp.]|uniref:TetR/AcrR family transcriptional regulator n=1 Tax=Roseibium sp. TaxID=1936156 RepID=UPI0026212ED6|nr:TetR/AcrR family transcriptional regulator [Roseibium sp.]MCV0426518.1 TetR/AcrR family transcriptional regulator [Roseibium sp.]